MIRNMKHPITGFHSQDEKNPQGKEPWHKRNKVVEKHSSFDFGARFNQTKTSLLVIKNDCILGPIVPISRYNWMD